MTTPRTALVGIGGYGRVHLRHLLDFHQRGELKLVAVVSVLPEPEAAVLMELGAIGCEIFSSFEMLLAALPRLRVSLGVIPTPIHLHARMTLALLRAGVDVLVEKPLTALLADAQAIIAGGAATGRMVAVGFQYLHAPEIRELKSRLLAGAVGPVRRLVVQAAWPRSHAYYTRNTWAGRLKVGEDWVLDSPVSNAMSHFLMVMLFLAGREERALAEPVELRAELYRAQAIESFDTAVVHLKTAAGLKLDFYGTHSSREVGRPVLRVEGTNGAAEWVPDSHAQITGGTGDWHQAAEPESHTRELELRDVLGYQRGESALICTPKMAAVHVRCITELYQHTPIRIIPNTHTAQHEIEGQLFTYVPGLDEQLARAARGGLSLAQVGAPWAVATPGEQRAI